MQGNVTHGHFSNGKPTPTYYSWASMKQRCLNPNQSNYEDYGARGITVCPRWLSFENFLADMGERPEGTTLDRIDFERGYSPDNCRWANDALQARNRRRNRILPFQGKALTMSEWSRHTGIGQRTIQKRLNLGWSIEQTLTTPVRKHGTST